MKQAATVILGLSFAIFAFGCSGGSEKLLPVQGKVTQGGKPFTKGGSVTYYADKAKGNNTSHTPTAELGPNGEYTLRVGDKEGAPPGHYKVVVVSQSKPKGTGKEIYEIPIYYVDKTYTSVDRTPLTREVKEGHGSEIYDINLP